MQNGNLHTFSYSADVSGRFNSYIHKISHELRTPLNHIIGFAEILALDGGFACDSRQSINAIVTVSHQLETLIASHIHFCENILENPEQFAASGFEQDPVSEHQSRILRSIQGFHG